MSVKKRVLIFGRTLNLEGIGVCLKHEDTLDVLVVGPHEREYLEIFNPEVILFDLREPPDELNLALMRKQPGVLLIGVDPSSDEVLLLTGQRNRIVSISELAKLVSGQAAQPATGDEVTGEDQGGAFELPD